MSKTEFPLLKEQLMKDFGYISFQLALANVDIIGIRILKSYEIVIITYSKSQKTGFIYKELGVKVTHIKTGLSCECTKWKSMHKNRAEALSVLVATLNRGE